MRHLYAAWEVSINVQHFKLIRLRAVSLLPENLRACCSWFGRLHTSHIRLIAGRLAQVFDQKRDCLQSIMVYSGNLLKQPLFSWP